MTTSIKPDASAFDAPERRELYAKARAALEQAAGRARAVIDIRHYLRRPTKAEIALSRRIQGELIED